MFIHYGQEDLAKTHQWELRREAEHQRETAILAPQRNVTLLAVSKLGALLGGLSIRRKRVEPSPKPITGAL